METLLQCTGYFIRWYEQSPAIDRAPRRWHARPLLLPHSDRACCTALGTSGDMNDLLPMFVTDNDEEVSAQALGHQPLAWAWQAGAAIDTEAWLGKGGVRCASSMTCVSHAVSDCPPAVGDAGPEQAVA